jgi:hypothetical protein
MRSESWHDIQISSRVAAQALLSRLNEVASEEILNFAKGAEIAALRRKTKEKKAKIGGFRGVGQARGCDRQVVPASKW